jgi:Ca2+-dependent lipid-binding protein
MASLELYELHIRVVEAKDLKDVTTFGKMDPYVILRVNNDDVKSQVATGKETDVS